MPRQGETPTGASVPPPAVDREGGFLYLSDLLGLPVLGPSGEKLGKLVDLVADASSAYPRVEALRVRSGMRGESQRIAAADVAEWGDAAVRLRRGTESLGPLQLRSSEIPLAQDVLDR